MKSKIRIATKQQFCFIEQEFDKDIEPDELVKAYDDLSRAYWNRGGLPDKEFDLFIQRMLEGDDNHIDQLEKMNPSQKYTMQIVKRALKRIDYKIKKKENTDTTDDFREEE